MPFSATDLITKFRDIGGENSATPTAATILKYLNLARNSPESPLLLLYPKLSSELSTLCTDQDVALVADTAEYTLTTKPDAVSKVHVKWTASDYYVPVDNFINRVITDNSPEALHASAWKPCVGYENGKAYVYPKPSVAVTAGLRFNQLVLPADITSTGSIVESNKIAMVEVKAALAFYYRANKRFDLYDVYMKQMMNDVGILLGTAPGDAPEKRVPSNRNNLSRFWRGGR